MKDLMREAASYPGLLRELLRWKGGVTPQKVFYGADERQYFLHFAPEGVPRETVVVYVHGGGWNKGSPEFFTFIGQRLAREGYRCILPGYRLAPGHPFPAQIDDVRAGTWAGLEYLRDQGIDLQRVAVVGSSAGAQLGALLCYDGELAGWFAGFAGLGGPYRFDLEPTLSMKRLCKGLLGGGDPLPAQPYYCLNEDSPKTPMLIVQGLGDGVVGYACGADFYRRALSLGIPARFYAPPGGRDSHSVYVAGCFLEERRTCETADRLFRWLEELEQKTGEPLGEDHV